MILHLLRHAKTEKQAETGKDFDRALMERGRLQAKEIAKFLETKKLEKTLFFCSSAKRTKQTFDEIEKRNTFQEFSILDQLYLAETKELLDFIWKLNSNQDIFILGHNNGLSDLATYFCGEHIHLKTSGYIAISFEAESSSEWSKDLGVILESYRPEV